MNNKNKRLNLFEELDLFKRMAKNIPAYGSFLKKQNFDHKKVKNISDLENVPVADKKNYIDKYDLKKLCWSEQISPNSYIVNSSGSSGKPYFWPRSEASDKASAKTYEIIIKDIFKTDKEPILFINSFGQGSWIAGNEAFLSMLELNKKGIPVTSINSGIEQSLIFDQLKRLAPYFTNIIFAGYPPFIKDTFELLNQYDKDILKKHSVYVVVGGESISEKWRNNVENILNAKKVEVISIYGMSDGGGVLAFETPVTKYIREQIFAGKDSLGVFGGRHNTGLFQYDPMTRYFTSGDQGQILIHVKNGLPLFKYDTKDNGGIVEFSKGISQFYDNTLHRAELERFREYPFVYLLGRSDHAVTFYGLNIYPEHIRAVIDQLKDEYLTGRFVLEKRENKNAQPELIVNLELAKNRKNSSFMNGKKAFIADHIYKTLPEYNSEYAKLVQSIDKRAKPKIKLKEFGHIGYKTGKKHRWVKKD